MKKEKGLSTERDRHTLTSLSSEKLQVLMKQAKADLFVEELVGYLLLFLAAVVSIAAIVILLTWLSVGPLATTWLHICHWLRNTAGSTSIGN
jgi:hypothetical protein